MIVSTIGQIGDIKRSNRVKRLRAAKSWAAFTIAACLVVDIGIWCRSYGTRLAELRRLPLASEQALQLDAAVHSLYGNQQTYEVLDVEALRTAGLAPNSMVVETNGLKHALGGSVMIDAEPGGFVIGFGGLSKWSCIRLAKLSLDTGITMLKWNGRDEVYMPRSDQDSNGDDDHGPLHQAAEAAT